MLRNTATAWGLPARLFHWVMAAMIAVQVPLGFRMNAVYNELTANGGGDWGQLLTISQIHHTMGFLILILAAARLAWRTTGPTPGMPAGFAAYQRMLARLTHVFLYALLFLFPLSGWAALSAYEGEFPIYFFGFDGMPRIVPQADGTHAPYEFYAEIHETCWKVGAGILGLHVAGALWHHFVLRDNVLTRMWRGS